MASEFMRGFVSLAIKFPELQRAKSFFESISFIKSSDIFLWLYILQKYVSSSSKFNFYCFLFSSFCFLIVHILKDFQNSSVHLQFEQGWYLLFLEWKTKILIQKSSEIQILLVVVLSYSSQFSSKRRMERWLFLSEIFQKRKKISI